MTSLRFPLTLRDSLREHFQSLNIMFAEGISTGREDLQNPEGTCAFDQRNNQHGPDAQLSAGISIHSPITLGIGTMLDFARS